MLQQSEHHGGWMLLMFPQLCFKAFWWDLLAPAGEGAHCKQRALFVPIHCFCKVKMPVYWQMRTQRPLMFVEFDLIWNTLVCIFCSIRCQQVPGSVSPRASKLFQSCKLSSTQPLGRGVEALIVRSAVARRCPSDKKKRKKKHKAPDWLSCLEATLNLGDGNGGNDSGATSGINQMLSFEKCVWKQSRCIPGSVRRDNSGFWVPFFFFLDTHTMKKSTSSLCFFDQSPGYLFQCNNEAPEGPNRRFGSFPINLSQKHFSTYKPPTFWLDGDVLKALGKMRHRVPRHDTDKLVTEHGMVNQQPVGSWKHCILGLRVTHNHETVTFFCLIPLRISLITPEACRKTSAVRWEREGKKPELSPAVVR